MFFLPYAPQILAKPEKDRLKVETLPIQELQKVITTNNMVEQLATRGIQHLSLVHAFKGSSSLAHAVTLGPVSPWVSEDRMNSSSASKMERSSSSASRSKESGSKSTTSLPST